ncbi:MAG: malectin domain-containing carbohydrate-binding protein, partial [Bacteroidota bacterium]
LFRINAAGPDYTTGAGDLFVADNYFANGSTASTGNAIAGTTDDALYQTNRWNANLQYNFPVSAGNYQVVVHFAEIWSGGQTPGVRVFDVIAEGQVMLDDYDIFADVGGYTAATHTFQIPVTDGNLDLDFLASANNAAVNAIEVYSAGSVSGSSLSANPDPVHFFSQQINTTSPPQAVSFVNDGVSAPITVSALSISGADAADFAHNFVGPATIASGDSIVVNFTFTPTTIGLKSAQINVVHDGTNTPLAVALTGEAVDNSFQVQGVVVNHPTCPGDADGSAAAVTTNGMMPFAYLWTPSGQTTDTATGLAEGTYTVRVIDANQDTVYAQVTLVADSLYG